MRIFLTGSASHVARTLLPALLNDPRISFVTGIDLLPPILQHPRFRHHQGDIRDTDIVSHMHDADALIHLAFVTMDEILGKRRHDRDLIHDINVNGSGHVFDTAVASGIKHIIHMSSAVVYGAWPDNPERIMETQLHRALTGFAYAEDKVAAEKKLDQQQATHPTVRVVRLRPHLILGPNALPYLRAMFTVPIRPWLPNPQPLSQCVHEQDLVAAVVLALFSDADGAFNLACSDAVSMRTMQAYRHRFSLPIPLPILKTTMSIAWRVTGRGTNPSWINTVRYHLALDSSRARTILEWKPKHDTVQAVLAHL